jgi:hypothetical protein
MITSTDQRRALRLLVTNATLNSLVRDGLATMQPGTVPTGTRRITVVWVAITEVGRGVLAALPLPAPRTFEDACFASVTLGIDAAQNHHSAALQAPRPNYRIRGMRHDELPTVNS